MITVSRIVGRAATGRIGKYVLYHGRIVGIAGIVGQGGTLNADTASRKAGAAMAGRLTDQDDVRELARGNAGRNIGHGVNRHARVFRQVVDIGDLRVVTVKHAGGRPIIEIIGDGAGDIEIVGAQLL